MLSFIYEWLDTKSNLKYIGRHCGELDDGYIGSGTIFRKEYDSRPADFIRTILWQNDYTDDETIKLKEDEILNLIPNDQLYNGTNRKYYNQVKNSWGYDSVNNPMRNPETVARMMATREAKGDHKDPHIRSLEKYGKEKLLEMKSDAMMGNKNGCGNKDKLKSGEHKRKIAESVQKDYEKKKALGLTKLANGGRPRAMLYDELIRMVKAKGFKESAKELGLSLAALKGRYYNAVSALKK